MSKSNLNTKDKILDKALEMFNERGIEYVGLRELAATLGMRVSNITYYFSTKDVLVYEISQQLTRANSTIMIAADSITLLGFLRMQRKVFENQVRFRCLMLSFVHVIRQNKQVAAAYRKVQNTRRTTIKSNIEILTDTGYLDLKDDAEKEFLVATIALVSRFWISEAAISFSHQSDETLIQNYLLIIARLLMPYSTKKGKAEIALFSKDP